MEHLRTATMKRTIIFTILLLLCSCGDKSSEDKSEQCGIGKYVYVDWYNTIHIDRECAARSGDNLKTMTERMASRHGVQFVDTCDLTSRGKSGEKHGFCPRCIDDKAYRHLSDIIDGNRHIENRRKLYDALVADNYDMGDYAKFCKDITDASKRRKLYDALVNDGYDMEPFDEFEDNIGYNAKVMKP